MFELTQSETPEFQKLMIEELEKFENQFYHQWFYLLKSQYKFAADLVRNDGFSRNSFFNLIHYDTYILLNRNISAVFNYTFNFTMEQMNKVYSKSVPVRKEADDIFASQMGIWSLAYGAAEAALITTTTVNYIDDSILTGIARGMDKMAIADMLEETKSPAINPVRASRIAKTESHTVMMKANLQTVLISKKQFRKFWISTIDDRTRGMKVKDQFNHVDSHWQERSAGEAFVISGEKIMFPGDPVASPGNRINCRCVLSFSGI